MDFETQVSRVALAFGIGLLMGLERGWSTREARGGTRAAGVRTFAISGLMGGVAGAMARGPAGALTLEGAILLGTAFVAFSAVIALFGREENRAANKFSATTTIAALLTFVLGAYAVLGNERVAAASAVAAAAVLIFREGLHGWVAKITRVEFESGLLLLAMTFIVLPIVPPGSVGPLGGVNLREIWIIAIVLASVSFAGYAAVKLLGERRGILVAAAAGGLVSSTAVAFTNARRAAAGEGTPRVLAAGIALATAVSFIRVAAIAAVLNPSLVVLVVPALLVSAAVAAGFAIISVYMQAARSTGEANTQFRNPFGFWSVLGMAITIGVLILAGRFINARYGAAGAVAGAAVMGFFDVDAMAVSMARLGAQNPLVGAYALLTGVATNTLTKVAISAFVGRRWFGIQIAALAVACLLVGWLTLAVSLAQAGP